MKIPEMPWTAAERRLGTLLDHFQGVHNKLAELGGMVMRAPKTPDPFVSILAVADGPRGHTTLGTTGRVADGRRTFELRSYFDLSNVALIVFGDLERVRVNQIILGNEPLTAAMDGCPVVLFPKWLVGIDVRVTCERF